MIEPPLMPIPSFGEFICDIHFISLSAFPGEAVAGATLGDSPSTCQHARHAEEVKTVS